MPPPMAARDQSVGPSAEQASSYQDQAGDYDAQSRAYADEHDRFERARARYDAQYGDGAYARYYSTRPQQYDQRFGPGAYDRDFGQGDQ